MVGDEVEIAPRIGMVERFEKGAGRWSWWCAPRPSE
jgi:hypothetical protein